MIKRYLVLPVIICALTVAVSVVEADVLVTQDGKQVMTEGPWEVKGRQIIFTTPEGLLSSIRLTEVDLEASELATNPPPPPPPPPQAPQEAKVPVKPSMVFTDENIGGSGGGSETFLGRLSREVDEGIQDLVDQLGSGSSRDAEAQSRIDAMLVAVDVAMNQINQTCSAYSTLDEVLTTAEELDAFVDDLNACADELEGEIPNIENEGARNILSETVGRLRVGAAGVNLSADEEGVENP